jgi:hypothetical protein
MIKGGVMTGLRVSTCATIALLIGVSAATAQGNKTVYKRQVQFDGEKYTLQLPKNEHPAITVPPGATVIIRVNVAGGKSFDTPIWVDTWQKWFHWKEERRDGKDTINYTVEDRQSRPRTVKLGTKALVLQAVELTAGNEAKKTDLAGEDTQIKVAKPATLQFVGEVSNEAPPFDKPRPDAEDGRDPNNLPQPKANPERVKVTGATIWFELEITVFN